MTRVEPRFAAAAAGASPGTGHPPGARAGRRRSRRSLWLFLAALGFGGLAAFAARGYISEQVALERERLQPKQQTVEVVVAKRDLVRGEIVGPDTMATRAVPVEYLSGASITPERFDRYAGARLALAMRAGEPLLHPSVEGADASTFSSKVRPGVRGVTVVVDEVNSISGMLQPGDRIDLLLTTRPPTPRFGLPAPETTVPFMQDVTVLATGRQVRPSADDGRGMRAFTTITIEADPEEAQRLVVAQRGGKLTALLRHPEDHGPLEVAPMDMAALLGIVQPEPVEPVTAELLIGGQGGIRRTLAIAGSGLPELLKEVGK